MKEFVIKEIDKSEISLDDLDNMLLVVTSGTGPKQWVDLESEEGRKIYNNSKKDKKSKGQRKTKIIGGVI